MSALRRTLALLALVAGTALPFAARAQRRAAVAPPTGPTPADQARARVALTESLRACLESPWHLAVELLYAPSGRLTAHLRDPAAAPAGADRCLARASARLARFAGPEVRADATLLSADPRPELLGTVDVAACIEGYDACSCHVSAGVSMNARRPGAVASVSFDAQGCVPTPEQLACIEAAIGRVAWPVHAGDPPSVSGPVGPACTPGAR